MSGDARERGALVIQHGTTGPPAIFGDWLQERGIPLHLHQSEDPVTAPDPKGYAFVATLGSARTPRMTDVPEVARHLATLERAIAQDVPVLGICYGGQALAKALGAEVEPAPEPELGWFEIDTDEPETVPPGPWLEWHFERFSTPPGAREIARTPRAVQAFRHGRHLGVQFHPEATVEIVAAWARKDAEKTAAFGVTDGVARIEGGRVHAEGARRSAFALFDAFLARATGDMPPTEEEQTP